MTDTGDIISAVIGWVYFAAWTISFWPQIISNYRRKSVVGLSFDYVFLNIIGFTCYSAYNLSLFWNPTIQQQYKNFYGEANKVQPNDVAFALHAVAASTLTGIQIFIYHQRGQQALFMLGKVMVPAYCAAITIAAIVFAAAKFEWFFFLYGLGYVKLSISLLKYCPQVFLNFKRKSTTGWNIWNVLLDFTGGVLSVVQLAFDSYRTGDWSGFSWDPKFILGNLSILFDVVFMVQHYILYRNAPESSEYKWVEDEDTHGVSKDGNSFR
eukprot:TRINITY_DN2564_c0_g1_i2.p1 TRINITY_DN2564_c0_g1~~TRINITY_DN2564_c0_g1_i2.p1  ORF type:complete len:267 (-),score=69.47 TRINITY_DN2564_c0_g1_i2:482-1282(-)